MTAFIMIIRIYVPEKTVFKLKNAPCLPNTALNHGYHTDHLLLDWCCGAHALELLQSCIKPSIWYLLRHHTLHTPPSSITSIKMPTWDPSISGRHPLLWWLLCTETVWSWLRNRLPTRTQYCDRKIVHTPIQGKVLDWKNVNCLYTDLFTSEYKYVLAFYIGMAMEWHRHWKSFDMIGNIHG